MAASMTLDVGEDRILLETRSNIYHLDIYLPFLLIQAECVAQFNRRTKVWDLQKSSYSLPNVLVLLCFHLVLLSSVPSSVYACSSE